MIPSEAQFSGEGPGLAPSPAVAANPAASPVTAAIGANRMAQATGGGSTPTAPKPIDKSGWNMGVKVPQSTVSAVKSMGAGNMGAKPAYDLNVTRQRLSGLTSSPGASDIRPRSANTVEREAVKRVYPSAYAQSTPGNTVRQSSRPFQ